MNEGYRNQIQRKGRRNKPLCECQHRRNTRTAKTRARVEHVFAAIEQMGGKLIRTSGKERANFAMTMMTTCYNLKRLVYFRKAGIRGLLTPMVGRIALASGDSSTKRGVTAEKRGD